MRPTLTLATLFVLAAVPLAGCDAGGAPGSRVTELAETPGFRVTEVAEKGDFTAVYVEIDPARGDLPVTLMQDQVRLQRPDGSQAPLAGIAPKGALAMGLPGLTISASGDARVLDFELIAGEQLTIVAPLDREPRAGEIVLVFKGQRAGASRVEIKTSEVRTLTLPLP